MRKLLLWSVVVVLAATSAASASPAARHRPHRVWIDAVDNCYVTEAVAPTGSTAGAPTPLPGLQVTCAYVPGHWRRV